MTICKRCEAPYGYGKHDPCIPNLPGVINACCGHGHGPGYVMFEDGRVIRGWFDHAPPFDSDPRIAATSKQIWMMWGLMRRKINDLKRGNSSRSRTVGSTDECV